MNEELIKEIFIIIAFRAMDSGKELRLEKGKSSSKSGLFGGSISQSSTDSDSFSLLVYKDGEHEDFAEGDEEETEEDEQWLSGTERT